MGTEDPRHRLGVAGEEAVCKHFEALGWQVRDRNWRCSQGELDLIVEQDPWLVFVEVRTHSKAGRVVAPEDTVTVRKQRRIARAARRWLAGHPSPWRVFRFDVVGVVQTPTGGFDLRHVEDAFRVDGFWDV